MNSMIKIMQNINGANKTHDYFKKTKFLKY
jgi:hypothetical protein